jgi:hypothetical protein
VNWTIGGRRADATTCTSTDFAAGFADRSSMPDDTIYSQWVGCAVGTVVQNRVPLDLTDVTIWGTDGQLGEVVTALPSVTFDLACSGDNQCANDVCSIVGTCEPTSDVQTVNVTWTVNGQPANASSCAGFVGGDLALQFGNSGSHGYTANLLCASGAFSLSKVPTGLQTVLIYGALNGASAAELLGSGTIANGSATVDLMP